MNRLLAMILTTLVVVSCGTPGDRFRLEGRFRNFNQGDLYVYSTDNPRHRARLDTIHVADGRFLYDVPMEDTVTLVIVFPNYSELPVFARPGTKVSVEADASHLKETKVMGTDDNRLMTEFRLAATELTPPEVVKAAAAFIEENPLSPVSRYLLNRYFIISPEADLAQAHALAKAMLNAAPDDTHLRQLVGQLAGLKASQMGARLPKFAAVDMKGRKVTNADLKGQLNVITTWASWSYESQNLQRQLRKLQKEYGAQKLALLSICLNPRLGDCRETMRRDSLQWPQVCDGKMWQTPLLEKLGLADLPDNIVTDRQGKVVGRSLSLEELKDLLKKELAK